MLDINASAEGVFVFISQILSASFIDGPQAPSGPTTHTILAAGRLPAPVSARAWSTASRRPPAVPSV